MMWIRRSAWRVVTVSAPRAVESVHGFARPTGEVPRCVSAATRQGSPMQASPARPSRRQGRQDSNVRSCVAGRDCPTTHLRHGRFQEQMLGRGIGSRPRRHECGKRPPCPAGRRRRASVRQAPHVRRAIATLLERLISRPCREKSTGKRFGQPAITRQHVSARCCRCTDTRIHAPDDLHSPRGRAALSMQAVKRNAGQEYPALRF